MFDALLTPRVLPIVFSAVIGAAGAYLVDRAQKPQAILGNLQGDDIQTWCFKGMTILQLVDENPADFSDIKVKSTMKRLQETCNQDNQLKLLESRLKETSAEQQQLQNERRELTAKLDRLQVLRSQDVSKHNNERASLHREIRKAEIEVSLKSERERELAAQKTKLTEEIERTKIDNKNAVAELRHDLERYDKKLKDRDVNEKVLNVKIESLANSIGVLKAEKADLEAQLADAKRENANLSADVEGLKSRPRLVCDEPKQADPVFTTGNPASEDRAEETKKISLIDSADPASRSIPSILNSYEFPASATEDALLEQSTQTEGSKAADDVEAPSPLFADGSSALPASKKTTTDSATPEQTSESQ